MPEVAIHEDRDFPARENNIGSARDLSVVDSESAATRVQRATKMKFGSSVATMDSRHYSGSNFQVSGLRLHVFGHATIECMRKDANEIAAAIVAQATGERPKNPFAVALAKRRAELLGPERRHEIAVKAARKRWKGHKKK